VVAAAVMVAVFVIGVSTVSVVVGTSGARRPRRPARLSLAASIRARAHSTSTARSPFLIQRWNMGMVVGVARAAGVRSVGLYLHGLSGLPGMR
jgi:hypothetical protein